MRALLLACAALAACSDPALSITRTYRAGDPLEAFLAAIPSFKTRVRAVDADLAAQGDWPRAPGASGPASCHEIMFGRVPPELLDAATVTETGTGVLAGVPRLGAKRIVVEVLGDRGLLLGFGCAEVGDITDDVEVEVEIVAAARVVRLGRNDGSAADSVRFVAAAAWNDDELLVRPIEIDRYHGGEPLAALAGARTTSATASTEVTGLLADTVPGPVQALVRVEGAQALRVPLFHEWPRVLTASGSDRIRLPVAPGTTPAGAAGLIGLTEALDAWIIAASYVDASTGHRHLAVVGGKDGRMEVVDQEVADDLGVPVVWQRKLLLIGSDGWHPITRTVNGFDVGLPLGAPGAPALEAVPIKACDDSIAAVLVRRAPGAVYEVYALVNMVPTRATGADLTQFAAALGSGKVLSSVCAVGDRGVPVEIVMVERADGALAAVPYKKNRVLPLEGVTAVTDFASAEGDPRALAAIETVTGPRARTFRLENLDGVDLPAVIPTSAIDVPLAASPSALTAARLDGDAEPDLVAVIPTPTGARLEAVLDDRIAGEALAAVTQPFELSPLGAAGRIRVLFIDADRAMPDNRAEVVVISADGLDVFAP